MSANTRVDTCPGNIATKAIPSSGGITSCPADVLVDKQHIGAAAVCSYHSLVTVSLQSKGKNFQLYMRPQKKLRHMLAETDQVVVSVVVAHIIPCSSKDPCWIESPPLGGFHFKLCPLQKITVSCCSIVDSARPRPCIDISPVWSDHRTAPCERTRGVATTRPSQSHVAIVVNLKEKT